MSAPRLVHLIEKLIEYNWSDELEDYRENCSDGPEDNARRGHIFETLVELDNFISGSDRTPADVLAEYAEEQCT